MQPEALRIEQAFAGLPLRDGRLVYRRPNLKPNLIREVVVLPGDDRCVCFIGGVICGSHFGEERAVNIPISKLVDAEAGSLTLDNFGRALRFESFHQGKYLWLWHRSERLATTPEELAFERAMMFDKVTEEA